MGIFRGEGGSGDATTDAIASQVSIDSASASSSATTATDRATAAASSAATASVAAGLAISAQVNSGFDAQNAATSETNASSFATQAGTSAQTASQAKIDAVSAKTSAETAETNASASATTASTKAGEASASATTASTKAGQAATSASIASTAATAAASSAFSASTSATNASNSATSAASSLTSINAFYLGSASSNPTVDGNGNAVTAGDWYFNTSDNTTRIYTGSAWNNIEAVGATNVAAAGALMDSEVTNLAQVKAFDSSDYATSAQGTTADNALPKAGGAVTGAITTNSTFDGRDVATDGTKLDGIEALADVTDALNVAAAGALMDSEVTNLAQVKAFDSSDYATSAQGTTADSAMQNLVEDTSPQLGGNLDLNSNNITGTGNITTTGTLQTSSNVIVGGDLTVNGTTTTVNTETINLADNNIVLNSNHTGAPSQNSGITVERGTSADKVFQWNETTDVWETDDNFNVNGNITVTGNVDGRDVGVDGAKLDNIEANADVTDTTNVTAAGALMDSELTDLTAVKSLDQGVATTDTPTFDGLTVDKSSQATIVATSDSTVDVRLVADTSLTEGSIRTSGTTPNLGFYVGGTKYANIGSGGDISFYEDTGTTAKLFWDASAESLGLGVSSPQKPLHVYHATIDNVVRVESGDSRARIEIADGDTTVVPNIGVVGNNFTVDTNGSERLSVNSTGIDVTGSGTFTGDVIVGGASGGKIIVAGQNFDSFETSIATPSMYQTGSGGSGIFAEEGHLVIQPRTNNSLRSVVIAAPRSQGPVVVTEERLRVSSSGIDVTGDVVTDGLTVAGDVSIDSGTIKLDGNYPVGTDNVAIGNTALDSILSTALRNVAIGSKALTGVTTGDDNVAIGFQAGLQTNSIDNIAIGNYALDGADSGTGRNIAIGKYSMTSNLASGCFANTCLGYRTGNQITSGNDNTLLGYEAGVAITTGSDNVAIGKNTLDNINTENYNVAIGHSALGGASSSNYSTAVGYRAGLLITTGSHNTILGSYTGNQDGLDIRTLSNRIVITDGGGNIGMYVDNSQDAHFDGNVIAYSTTISDRRLKSDITNISNALDKVGQINGVTFVRNHNGEKAAGIVAQEIMEVLPEAVKSQALPLQTGEHDKEYYVVEYDAVTGLLVEAVKELKARVEALESK